MSTDIKNPYQMSMDELRAAAEAELQSQPTPQPAIATEQPRDEKGRFASAATQEGQEYTSNEPIIYRRTIENEDGTIDVYEAGSLEELIDKIADGKKNANRQIKVLATENKELRQRTTEAPKPKEFTQDDEYVFSQELMSKPTQAFRKMFKELVGYDIEEFKTLKEAADAADSAKIRHAAITSFIASHPDYHDGMDADGQRNTDLIAMAIQGQDFTSENLHKAYLRLKNKGLLVLKPVEANSGQEPTQQQEERTVQPAVERVTPQRTKKASGLSTNSPRTVAPVNTEPSEDEMYKLPMEELLARANKQLAPRR